MLSQPRSELLRTSDGVVCMSQRRLKLLLFAVFTFLAFGIYISTAERCYWTTDAVTSRALLVSCAVQFGGDADVDDVLERWPYDPGEWISKAPSPPVPWPRPVLLQDVTIQLPSCEPLWALSERECTFRLSTAWPVAGLKVGEVTICGCHG